MLAGMKRKSILLMGLALIAVSAACGDTQESNSGQVKSDESLEVWTSDFVREQAYEVIHGELSINPMFATSHRKNNWVALREKPEVRQAECADPKLHLELEILALKLAVANRDPTLLRPYTYPFRAQPTKPLECD